MTLSEAPALLGTVANARNAAHMAVHTYRIAAERRLDWCRCIVGSGLSGTTGGGNLYPTCCSRTPGPRQAAAGTAVRRIDRESSPRARRNTPCETDEKASHRSDDPEPLSTVSSEAKT